MEEIYSGEGKPNKPNNLPPLSPLSSLTGETEYLGVFSVNLFLTESWLEFRGTKWKIKLLICRARKG